MTRIQMRVVVPGAKHPDALTSASNLAATLFDLHQRAEARQLLGATLEAQWRVLGATHPDTLDTARSWEEMQSQMRASQTAATAG